MQSIGAISEAGLRALWRSPDGRFPTEPGKQAWEVWLGRSGASGFLASAADYGVAVGTDRLEFPEDVVVIAVATAVELAAAVRDLGGVRALATPTRNHLLELASIEWSKMDKRQAVAENPRVGLEELLPHVLRAFRMPLEHGEEVVSVIQEAFELSELAFPVMMYLDTLGARSARCVESGRADRADSLSA